MALIQSTAIPSGATDYELEQSLRFNDDDSTYLTKTFASAGNRKTWTFSCWLKRGNLTQVALFRGPTEDTILGINSNHFLGFYDYIAPVDYGFNAAQKFRDASAWYHIVAVMDTTNGTSTDRMKTYVNGQRITSFEADYGQPALNWEGNFNNAGKHNIGFREHSSTDWYLDGYLGEVNFVDGQALTPADFGETGTYGEWKPIEYSGTYGTNGFYLPFKQDYTVEGFSATTYPGNGATNHYIGGTGFQPDLLWVKKRSASGTSHMINDSVRGAGRTLYGNLTNAESALSTSNITAFNTDGFSLGTGGSVNDNGSTFIAWSWDMGGSNASNSNGGITSTVRANTTYGQSIVSYTGTGSSATVGHGLSSKPDVVLTKRRDSTSHWLINDWSGDYANKLKLNDTETSSSSDSFVNDASATTFTLGTDTDVNANNGTYIAYCFHNVTGYSKFGSYTGDGSSSKQITTGFKPAFVMIKNVDTTYRWYILDNTRDPTNPAYHRLFAQSNDADATNSNILEFNDTGFNLITSDAEVNQNGSTHIYMAFADKREYAYWLDQSGNNNDWTSVNLTESDISVDSPTNNFCTFNPLNHGDPGSKLGTLSEGNLKMHYNEAGTALCLGTMAPTSGKWYCEFTYIHGNAASDRTAVGIADPDNITITGNGNSEKLFAATTIDDAGLNRVWLTDNVESDNNFPARLDGAIIQFAWDMDAGKFWLGTNNQWSNSSGGNINVSDVIAGNNATVTDSGCVGMTPVTRLAAGESLTNTHFLNCGQDSSFAGNKVAQGNQDGNGIGDFYYTPPTGFLALCTKNMADVAVIPSEHFNTITYTGNNGASGITGVGFQPDFAWFKARNLTEGHMLFDAVRGAAKTLFSNTTGAENTSYTNVLSAFNADGYTLGSNEGVNHSSGNYVAWNWKANGSGSSNTAGDINSTVSANVDAGFSIVSYTGNGTVNQTVGHGLSKTPEIIIIKGRENANFWSVINPRRVSTSNTNMLYLNVENAEADDTNVMGDNLPTATTFGVDDYAGVNVNNLGFIAYCFHSVDGYSKMGSYTGNASSTPADGTFVYTSFKPLWLMVRRADATGNWRIYDTKRSPFNYMDELLSAEANDAEAEGSTSRVDFLSNGFKMRGSASGTNRDGGTYIYMAFAETPFKYSNAR